MKPAGGVVASGPDFEASGPGFESGGLLACVPSMMG